MKLFFVTVAIGNVKFFFLSPLRPYGAPVCRAFRLLFRLLLLLCCVGGIRDAAPDEPARLLLRFSFQRARERSLLALGSEYRQETWENAGEMQSAFSVL